jgi:CRISPR-associated protein Cas1
MSRETGVEWAGRQYDRSNWRGADPINRALSAANSCLYGVAHAAIISAGYSPAIGFIHTGKMLSFVYDVADLYKVETIIPVAFRAVGEGTDDLEGRVRRACRDIFHRERLLQRIVPDMDRALSVEAQGESDFDADDALPGGLWDPQAGTVAGGVNQADVTEGA